MKLTAISSAALSVMVLILGLLFMLHELPYSNYILVVSLIIFYTLDKEIMYIAGAIFCLLPIIGLMFTQLNLPGARLLLTVGLILFGIFFVPWFALKCFKG